ncbi:plasmid stabilization protein [Methylobacterium sp. E-016]|uniref:FitA-like ribbon-helix-helix domain-containing protein n=1 Tax=Methylobacterium sp. E-016 TaxID=2836556 RepID=UPI001FB9B65E|nr:plasmid stabilization protein [Methylobacterium sp. E-016]MCJ2076449.1 plasmid stabilization protein [Methylobacterium sp. E-016]
MAHALAPTATIAIRNLDNRVKERLRIRAAMNGRSMEVEARSILVTTLAVEAEDAPDLAEAIRRRMAPFGGIDLEEHSAVTIGAPPSFDR